MNKYHFEQKLKAYIKQSGRSQAATARKLGERPDTFNKWVRGINQIPIEVLNTLCMLLGLSHAEREELFSLAGYSLPWIKPGVASSPLVFDEDEAEQFHRPSYNHYKEAHYPADFRAGIIACIGRTLAVQRSVRVVGLSGMGKSNVLRFLVAHPNLLADDLGLPTDSLCWIHVDGNQLRPATPLRFYQACHHQFNPNEAPVEDEYLAYQALHRTLADLPPEMVVVLVIDRAESLYHQSGESFFNQLRTLHDNAQAGRMRFIIGTKKPVGYLYQLEKLFARVCWVDTLRSTDRAFSLGEHERRLGIDLPVPWEDLIWRVSGEHPGLLKNSLAWCWHQGATTEQLNEEQLVILNYLVVFQV